MRVILLAAGFGTRMYPLTRNMPKALLEVAGRAVIDYLLEQLVALPGVRTIHLISNARFYGRFVAWRETVMPQLQGRKIELVLHDDGVMSNEARLGAVGDLGWVLERIGVEEGVFVAATDNILRFRLQPVWERFLNSDANYLLALRESDPARLRRSGVLELGKKDKVLALHEKPAEPPSNWICPPFYFLQPSALAHVSDLLAQPKPPDAPGHLIAYLLDKELFYAYRVHGTRFDIGSMASYEEAKRVM